MSKHTPGPWEYIPSTEHHGPYVTAPWGGDVADCYTMSNPNALSVRNGGDSRPIFHQGENADANARLIAAAPTLVAALEGLMEAVPTQTNDRDWWPDELTRAMAAARKALDEAGVEP